MNGFSERVEEIDQWMLRILFHLQQYFTLGVRGFSFAFSRPFFRREFIIQLDEIGVRSLGPLILTSTFTGMVLSLQGMSQLAAMGAESLLGNIIGATLSREAAPIMAAIVVSGRVSSGIAAEIGYMRISEQLDALMTFGTDPIRRLVTPRLLAATLMMPVLTVIALAAGILGALFVATSKGSVEANTFMSGVFMSFTQKGFIFVYFPTALLDTLVKPVFYGAVIALTGCYCGLATEGGGLGVGKSVTAATVASFIIIVVSDYFLTFILMRVYNLLLFGQLRAPGHF